MRNTTRRPRFKLHSIDEIWSMSTEEWNQECRLSGADFAEHPEEASVREERELKKVGLKT